MEKSDTIMGGKAKNLKIEMVYNKTTEWISDFRFYEYNLRFIQHSLDRSRTEMTLHGNLDELREISMRLQDVKYNCSSLTLRIGALRKKFARVIPWEMTPTLKKENSELYADIETFTHQYKIIKKEVQSIVEHLLEIKKKEKWQLDFERIRSASRV